VAILLSGFLIGCGNRHEDYILPDIFSVQSQDELLQIIAEEFYGHDEVYIGATMQQISEYVSLLLNIPGKTIEMYLEDFDFIVDAMGYDLLDSADTRWSLVRYGIESFFFVNDFIFHYLMLSVVGSVDKIIIT